MAIDSSESSESITNDEDPDVLLTSRPISPSMSEVSVPQAGLPLTEYASSSMGNPLTPPKVQRRTALILIMGLQMVV